MSFHSPIGNFLSASRLSADQIKVLLKLAADLPDRPKGPDRGRTYHLMFALMYTLGLRVGMVSRLELADIALKRRLLQIRQTKFGKDRLVPFGPAIAQHIITYIDWRNALTAGCLAE